MEAYGDVSLRRWEPTEIGAYGVSSTLYKLLGWSQTKLFGGR